MEYCKSRRPGHLQRNELPLHHADPHKAGSCSVLFMQALCAFTCRLPELVSVRASMRQGESESWLVCVCVCVSVCMSEKRDSRKVLLLHGPLPQLHCHHSSNCCLQLLLLLLYRYQDQYHDDGRDYDDDSYCCSTTTTTTTTTTTITTTTTTTTPTTAPPPAVATAAMICDNPTTPWSGFHEFRCMGLGTKG